MMFRMLIASWLLPSALGLWVGPTTCNSSSTLNYWNFSFDANPEQISMELWQDECNTTSSEPNPHILSFANFTPYFNFGFGVCFLNSVIDNCEGRLRMDIVDSAGNGLTPPAFYRIKWLHEEYSGDLFGSRATHYFTCPKYCGCISPCPPEASPEDGICFSASTRVQTKDKGEITIDEVEIGDQVLSGSGTYETIFTIDHLSKKRTATFMQIFTRDLHSADTVSIMPLEVTPKHMVFVEGKVNPVQASSLKEGDWLQGIDGPKLITKIMKRTRHDGVYNPITTDGTIVVNNGIIASTYSVRLAGNSEYIDLFKGYETVISHQNFFNMVLNPLKHFCMGISPVLCQLGPDSYQEKNEKIMLSYLADAVYDFWVMQSELWKSIILAFTLVTLFVFHIVFSTPCGFILFVPWAYFNLFGTNTTSNQK